MTKQTESAIEVGVEILKASDRKVVECAQREILAKLVFHENCPACQANQALVKKISEGGS